MIKMYQQKMNIPSSANIQKVHEQFSLHSEKNNDNNKYKLNCQIIITWIINILSETREKLSILVLDKVV